MPSYKGISFFAALFFVVAHALLYCLAGGRKAPREPEGVDGLQNGSGSRDSVFVPVICKFNIGRGTGRFDLSDTGGYADTIKDGCRAQL